jgi:hypothetical protein
MKPIDPPKFKPVWILASINSGGTLSYYGPNTAAGSSTSTSNYFTSLEDAQQEQFTLALRNIKAHLFNLEFPI